MIKGILDFMQVNIGFGFDVQAKQALKYFESKGLKPSFSFADVTAQEHATAFTVAKMMDMDLLKDVQDSLYAAMTEGLSYQQWSERIIPTLQANGWWGRQPVYDPLTGKTVVSELGSSRRLQTIFRTNMQSAYAVGHWQQIMAQAKDAPYLLYDAIDDFRTRPKHRAWDNTVLPITDPFWNAHTPPNGWGCRCSVIQLSADDLDAMGLKVSDSPKVKYVDWKNPRTGKVERTPDGVDAGFGFNAGQARYEQLQKLAREKVAAIEDQSFRAAATDGLMATDQKIKSSSIQKTEISLTDQDTIVQQWIPSFQRTRLLAQIRQPQVLASNQYNLTEPEMMAIRYYTQDGFYDLNGALGGDLTVNDVVLSDATLLLNQALSKLPDYKGVVVRRANLEQLPVDVTQVRVGQLITINGFTSTTSGSKDIFVDRPIRMIIDAKTGKDIDWISASGVGSFKREFEVLFRHPSQFLVIKIDLIGDTWVLKMIEV